MGDKEGKPPQGTANARRAGNAGARPRRVPQRQGEQAPLGFSPRDVYKRQFRHFTDLHACACEGVEPADRLQYCQAREKGFASPEMTSAARMPYLFAYGQRIQADMLFLTGDIIDFPSDANLALLKSCVRKDVYKRQRFGDVIEIDTFEELKALDPSYADYPDEV